MEAEVSDVLAGYVVGGFLGDYPREDFVDGPRRLHQQGRRQVAAADIDVLTGSRFEDASRGAGHRPRRQALLLSTRAKAVVGASAYVDFDFDVLDDEGEVRRRSLTGRFASATRDDGWQVFGYDVLRDDSDALPAEASS